MEVSHGVVNAVVRCIGQRKWTVVVHEREFVGRCVCVCVCVRVRVRVRGNLYSLMFGQRGFVFCFGFFVLSYVWTAWHGFETACVYVV